MQVLNQDQKFIDGAELASFSETDVEDNAINNHQ